MTFIDLTDLAVASVGGRAIAANDDFFAPRRHLVAPAAPVFVPGKFTSRGKWMDGWETRRRRTPGHDWCVVALGMRGIIRGVNVDTSYFTGNYPEHCSIDALDLRRTPTRALVAAEGRPWVGLVSKSPLRGNSQNLFPVDDERPWTHVRLNIFPDGGVARLRVHGEVVVDWDRLTRGRRLIDLAAIQHGGLTLAASDVHFGAKENLIMPGRAANMGDGWETRRRRGPGYDWVIVKLGSPGVARRIEVDTNHFKGNYPESCSLDACLLSEAPLDDLSGAAWRELVPRARLRADSRHLLTREIRDLGPVSHVRLNIYPDGGVSRLRVLGTPVRG